MRYLPVSQKGQAILLVLLSMSVVLTVVLSVVSRSLTDIKITSQDEASQRAFSAAEAGIEQALVGGTLIGDLGDNASYQALVDSYSSDSTIYVSPQGLLSGDRVIVWFVSHNAAGNLICNSDNPCFTGSQMKVCWGNKPTGSSDSTTPALEVSVFYTTNPGVFTDFSQVRVAREALDPNATRANINGFNSNLTKAGTCELQGESFQFEKTLSFSSDVSPEGLKIPSASYNNEGGLLFVVLRLLYNTTSHKVGIDVTGGSNLPTQGTIITSLGTSGEANRKIEVTQSVGALPPVFDSAVFSLGGLSK